LLLKNGEFDEDRLRLCCVQVMTGFNISQSLCKGAITAGFVSYGYLVANQSQSRVHRRQLLPHNGGDFEPFLK
jgi:hypothetical protein